jgi:hypothetical protein
LAAAATLAAAALAAAVAAAAGTLAADTLAAPATLVAAALAAAALAPAALVAAALAAALAPGAPLVAAALAAAALAPAALVAARVCGVRHGPDVTYRTDCDRTGNGGDRNQYWHDQAKRSVAENSFGHVCAGCCLVRATGQAVLGNSLIRPRGGRTLCAFPCGTVIRPLAFRLPRRID